MTCHRLAALILLSALLALATATDAAHAQFVRWLEVDPAALEAADAGVHLMRGARTGRSARVLLLRRTQVSAIRLVGAGGERPLTDQLLEHQPRILSLDAGLLGQTPGWVVVDLQDETREWQPSRWRAFLAAEGFSGPALPGWGQAEDTMLRIRGHSSFKALLHRAGGTRTEAVTRPVGQALEIVLLAVPAQLNGNLLPVRLLYRGQALAGAHLLAANPDSGMELMLTTNAKGEAVVPLRALGTWILSATNVGPGDGTVDAEFFSTTVTIHRR